MSTIDYFVGNGRHIEISSRLLLLDLSCPVTSVRIFVGNGGGSTAEERKFIGKVIPGKRLREKFSHKLPAVLHIFQERDFRTIA